MFVLEKNKVRLLDGNIPKVYYKKLYKVNPDLNNMDIQSIAQELKVGTPDMGRLLDCPE